jgi:hypothetical protein
MYVCLSPAHRHPPITLPAQGKGASVNEKDEGGVTALIAAADEGHKYIVEFLVVRRMNVRDRYIDVHGGAGDGCWVLLCIEVLRRFDVLVEHYDMVT